MKAVILSFFVVDLLLETTFAIAWIEAWNSLNDQPHIDSDLQNFNLVYYFDDATIRLLSSRDKFFLAVLAYFIPVNPSHAVPSFGDIPDWIHVIQAAGGTESKNESSILAQELFMVLMGESWTDIRSFRNEEIHRLDPGIFSTVIGPQKYKYLVPVWTNELVPEAANICKTFIPPSERRHAGIINDDLDFITVDNITYKKEEISELWKYDELFPRLKQCHACISNAITTWLDHLSDKFPFGKPVVD
jgi:hypothetical protein